MTRLMKCLCALLCVPLALSGCAARGAGEEDARVLASFYPVYILAINLLDGVPGVSLNTLAAPDTGCLHEYQLLPADMRKLSDADLMLICGAGMEDYLDELIEQLPGLAVLDTSRGAELISAEDEDGHDEDDEHGHEHEHEHEYNPHIWLSVPNAKIMTENIALGLKELLPEQSDLIDRNLTAYLERLDALDAELRAGLAALEARDIVTFHEAFPYFAREYNLNIVAVVAHEHDQTLSPRQLANLIELVNAAGDPPLFTEPQYSDLAARTVARETGAPVYALDPLVTGELTSTAYEDGMRSNMRVLIEALSR